MQRLWSILKKIDGLGYGAYKDIQGVYDYGDFTLYIDHVQGDPFAPPSRFRVRVPANKAGFPPDMYKTGPRRLGLAAYLARRLGEELKARGRARGTGKSGLFYVDCGGQEVLERAALVLADSFLEARVSAGLPAEGRRIAGKTAAKMLLEELPAAVRASLFSSTVDMKRAWEYVLLKEDQDWLRSELEKRDLVCFVADGSVLPRESGVSQKPLLGAVPFAAPPELAVELELPNRGVVRGMGIPAGVTLIVGGGYHGKSTLLRAIERGVYDHVPGDGRELVITRADAVKIRSEDGRRVEKVDISPFIKNLPFGGDTGAFSTDCASGSTSMAANIMEALEAGCRLLLLDEDTSATNFMIRDARMQALVAASREPITPFIDKVRQLYRELGVSTVLVMGGSGDYFDVADLVIAMEEYRPRVVTAAAKNIAQKMPTGRKAEGGASFGRVRQRIPARAGFNPERGGRVKADAKGLHTVVWGRTVLDLSYLDQLADESQTRAIAAMLLYMGQRYVDGKRTLLEVLRCVFSDIEAKGLDVISPFYGQHPGDYALPRLFEVAAAVNRLRTLAVKQLSTDSQ